jgi:predicted RNase H-like HicB family nuclease
MAEYLIVIERGRRNYAAYSPDVPGCVATGATRREAKENFRDALRMHLDGLRAEGYPIPRPTASVARVAI